jgi:biopolymer transport protein ExbB
VFARAITGYRTLLSDASGEILQHLSRDLELNEKAEAASRPLPVRPAPQDQAATPDRLPRAAALRSAE